MIITYQIRINNIMNRFNDTILLLLHVLPSIERWVKYTSLMLI